MGLDTSLPGDPAAGVSGFAITAGTGKTQVLRSVFFLLTTSAVAGNRYVTFSITNGTNGLYIAEVPFAQTASKAWYYSFALDSGRSTTTPDGVVSMPIPRIALKEGYKAAIDVSQFGSGMFDNADAITLVTYQLQDISPYDTGRL